MSKNSLNQNETPESKKVSPILVLTFEFLSSPNTSSLCVSNLCPGNGTSVHSYGKKKVT